MVQPELAGESGEQKAKANYKIYKNEYRYLYNIIIIQLQRYTRGT